MRVLVIFALIVSVALAARLSSTSTNEIDLSELNQKINNVKIDLPDEMVAELIEILKNDLKKNEEERAGSISAIINEYADKIFENLQRLFIQLSLDPFKLPDSTLDVLAGNIKLTSGWLQELATVCRGGDLSVEYSTSTKLLKFNVPVKFETLLFTYDYKTTILLVSISGGVDGNIKDVTADVVLSFDFNTLHAALEKMDLNAGKISVHFTGHLTDIILNAMSGVVTTFLKGLIMAIVESILKSPAEQIVDAFNSIIDKIFHATTTAAPLAVEANIW